MRKPPRAPKPRGSRSPTTTTTSHLPLLLAVYPGPADTWECASLPLAKAGYAVLAAGPAYSNEDLDFLAGLERPETVARAVALSQAHDYLGVLYLGGDIDRRVERRERAPHMIEVRVPHGSIPFAVRHRRRSARPR